MPRENKTEQYVWRLKPSVKDQLFDLAEAADMNVAEWLEAQVKRAIKRIEQG